MYLDTTPFNPNPTKRTYVRDESDDEDMCNGCKLCSHEDKFILIEKNDIMLLGGMMLLYLFMQNSKK